MADLIVKEITQLQSDYCLIKLTQENPLPEMLPGQFVQVRIDDSPKTFLRRPISVNFYDKEKNELWLLIQTVGEGTKKLSEIKAGSTLNILFPLGNSFSMPTPKDGKQPSDQKLLLVGGGVGTAPMLFLGAYLKSHGFSPDFLLGGRSTDNLLQLDEFRKYGAVYTTTEDGKSGEKGYVTNHSILKKEKYDRIYTCGPNPMMHAVAAYAKHAGITCEVSLENMMACGIGACLCCVENTHDGHICICTEGPVINIEKLTWQI